MHSLYQSDKPLVMGILNATPDSFSDGGQFNSLQRALEQAERMVEAGVDIIDIGGESTRPGASAVSLQQELDRVIPLISAIKHLGKPISIDTSKAEVMTESVAAGAAMINDVRALQEPGALSAAVAAQVPVCLMHMQGQPRTMQQTPHYKQVTADVKRFLTQRINACCDAGMDRSMLSIDPGFGFGKSLAHNITLLQQLEQLHDLSLPVLVGLSRKSMIGEITGQPVEQRLAGSIAAVMIAAIKQAKIIRVHDVEETVDAIKMFHAVFKH